MLKMPVNRVHSWIYNTMVHWSLEYLVPQEHGCFESPSCLSARVPRVPDCHAWFVCRSALNAGMAQSFRSLFFWINKSIRNTPIQPIFLDKNRSSMDKGGTNLYFQKHPSKMSALKKNVAFFKYFDGQRSITGR